MVLPGKRKVIIGIIILLLIVVIFYLFLIVREGRELPSNILNILPGEVSAYVCVKDFSKVYSEFKNTMLCKTFWENENFYRLLLSKKDFKKYKKGKEESENSVQIEIITKLLEKLFGENTVIAMVKIPDIQKPGIYIVSKTSLGFSGRIAEFTVQNTPSLNIKKEKYNNKNINIYTTENISDSFTYVKYGNSAVFSLGSPDTIYLKKFVDSVDSNAYHNYPLSIEKMLDCKKIKENLVAYIDPAKFIDDLGKFSDKFSIGKFFDKGYADMFKERLKKFEYIAIHSSLKEVFNLKVNFYFNGVNIENKDILYPRENLKHNLFKYIPVNSLIFLALSNPHLGEELQIRSPGVKTPFTERLFGNSNNIQFVSYIKDEAFISLEDVKAIGAFPLPIGQIFATAEDNSAAAANAQSIIDSLKQYSEYSKVKEKQVDNFTILYYDAFITTICSFAGDSVWGTALGIDALEKIIKRREDTMKTIVKNDLFLQLCKVNPIENAHLVVFINLELLGKKIEKFLPVLMFLDKDKEYMEQYAALLLNASKYAKAFLLTRKNYEEYTEINLTNTIE